MPLVDTLPAQTADDRDGLPPTLPHSGQTWLMTSHAAPQPDALFVIIPALTLPTQLAAFSYISMFVVGTVSAMGGYTAVIGEPHLPHAGTAVPRRCLLPGHRLHAKAVGPPVSAYLKMHCANYSLTT